eukprot:c16388_g1_i1 orf=145-426(-)
MWPLTRAFLFEPSYTNITFTCLVFLKGLLVRTLLYTGFLYMFWYWELPCSNPPIHRFPLHVLVLGASLLLDSVQYLEAFLSPTLVIIVTFPKL